MSEKPRKIELLAPAKDVDGGIAAIDYGADAVYIGGPAFGARYAAANSVEEIARLCDYARSYGARVYVALNTIVREEELAEAEKLAKELIAAGVDALIVQDMAFLRMGLEGVELHASTQTTNVSPEWVRFLSQAGFSRVILERGLSMKQIAGIARTADVEIETFVHGAICVCYSGRCYMSLATGERSGNRGECSQPCRLTYDLLDGDKNKVLTGKHLLSLKDMNWSGHISHLIEAGVSSFKIEGRLKDVNYIKNTVAYYRAAIDRAIAGRTDVVRASEGVSESDFTPDVSKSFNRGFTSYVLDGKRRGVASFNTPKSVGEFVGTVVSIDRDSFTLDRRTAISAGDGICFVAGEGMVGTNVNRAQGGRIFPNKMDSIARGMEIFRNHDHAFERILGQSRVRRTIDTTAVLKCGEKDIKLTVTDSTGVSVSVQMAGKFDAAQNVSLAKSKMAEQIAKSGGTIFSVVEVRIEGDFVPFIPAFKLNELRREALYNLSQARKALPRELALKKEDISAKLPFKVVGGDKNIVNSLSRKFYLDHGAEVVEAGYDVADSLDGVAVMRTPYCIRREIGQCLKEKSTIKGPLTLARGKKLYELRFDCDACEMEVINKIDKI